MLSIEWILTELIYSWLFSGTFVTVQKPAFLELHVAEVIIYLYIFSYYGFLVQIKLILIHEVMFAWRDIPKKKK